MNDGRIQLVKDLNNTPAWTRVLIRIGARWIAFEQWQDASVWREEVDRT